MKENLENWQITLNDQEIDMFVRDVIRATQDNREETIERIIKRLEEKEMYLICDQLLTVLEDFKGGKYTAVEADNVEYTWIIE